MVSVILYDDNPTVRGILKIALASLGFDVIPLRNILDCEQIMEQNKVKKLIAIIDASRIAEHINYLQTVIPRYISQQEHCILTTTYPALLTKYQPQGNQKPFFLHILERPFRLQAFIDFIWKLSAPLFSDFSASRRVSTRITSPLPSEESAHALKSMITSVEEMVDLAVENTEDMGSIEAKSIAVSEVDAEDSVHFPALQERPLESGRICNNAITRLINRACKRQLSYAIECDSDDLHSIVILKNGEMLWAETYSTDKLSDTETFFRALDLPTTLPKDALHTLLAQNVPVISALSTLHLTEELSPFFEEFIKQNLMRILSFSTGEYRIYHAQIGRFHTFLDQRPIFALQAPSILFDYYRIHPFIDELPLIHPEMSFIARPYRSMLNVGIQISREESEFLALLKTPKSYNDLLELNLPNFLCTIHRLISFDFIDFYFPSL